MIDELQNALSAYQTKWQKLIAARTDKQFFQNLKPTAVGWKASDRQEYNRLYSELHDQCERITETWMNGRWVAKMILKDIELSGGIKIIKIMQRRPESKDAAGLDHVDFYSPAAKHAQPILQKEKDLNWTIESNNVIDNYEWISLWFDNTEAKLKPHTVIDIVVRELEDINQQIKART